MVYARLSRRKGIIFAKADVHTNADVYCVAACCVLIILYIAMQYFRWALFLCLGNKLHTYRCVHACTKTHHRGNMLLQKRRQKPILAKSATDRRCNVAGSGNSTKD